MALLAIYGPHATGKTTALGELLVDLEGTGLPVRIVFADNNRVQWWDGDRLETQKFKGRTAWKGSAEGKRQLCYDCIADDSTVWVMESVRFDTHVGIARAHMDCHGGAHVLFIVCHWQTFMQFMMDRCNDKDKTYNAKYWTQAKLAYEGYGRYVNQARKYLEPAGVPYEVIEMDYGREAWADLDDKIWALATRWPEEYYR